MSTANKLFQAASGGAGESLYVEDVFSTYLYTGTGAAQTITNGIGLSGEGGLTWIKNRNVLNNHVLFDTERGATKLLYSNLSNAEVTSTATLTAFNSNGFSLGSNGTVNYSGRTYASWSFRKQAGFFDVVTYTGTGTGTGERTINHNLGSTPGVIILKDTSAAGDWIVYHRDGTNSGNYKKNLVLNNTNDESGNNFWVNAGITATTFRFNDQFVNMNVSGRTYVAYLFAHDAGGFGDDGSENIIKCGSFTTDSSGNFSVNLGFEPQWLLWKRTDGSQPWYMVDVMRGFPVTAAPVYLQAQSNAAEFTGGGYFLTNTGFGASGITSSANYIYIAIRRPMKTPESGTEVFGSNAVTSTGSNLDVTNNINMASGSLVISHRRDSTSNTQWFDNLRGPNKRLNSNSTDSEDTLTTSLVSWNMNGFTIGTQYGSTESQAFWSFKRAPGFFDVVAYTGNGASSQAINHNLGASPELIIVKRRELSGDWICQVPYTASPQDYMIKLNTNEAAVNFDDAWRDTAPTATNFTVGSWSNVNTNSGAYISYLFATLAGVSKVGSYTGTGSDLNVDCGFTSGARFILIKRTDSTGDWYVWDSARGIVAGNDPYLLLNSTAVEVTNTDYIDPLNAGFTVTSSAPVALNASGGTYIFLAIA